MENGCYIFLGCLTAIVVLYGLFELHYFLRMCLCGILARVFKRKCHILETTTLNGLGIYKIYIASTFRVQVQGKKNKKAFYFRRQQQWHWATKCWRILTINGFTAFALLFLDTLHAKGCLYSFEVLCFCLTNDIDTLITHMNNARYFRELDFARIDFYERTNLYRTIIAKGGSVYQGAATIRYRRFIRPFHRFKITSRIVYWDEQSVFMEHRFIRPCDKFVHAIAICRQRIINCSADDVMNELLTPKNSQAKSTDTLDRTEYGMAMTNLDQVENGQMPTKLRPEPPPEIVKWIEYNDLSSQNLRKEC